MAVAPPSDRCKLAAQLLIFALFQNKNRNHKTAKHKAKTKKKDCQSVDWPWAHISIPVSHSHTHTHARTQANVALRSLRRRFLLVLIGLRLIPVYLYWPFSSRFVLSRLSLSLFSLHWADHSFFAYCRLVSSSILRPSNERGCAWGRGRETELLCLLSLRRCCCCCFGLFYGEHRRW